MTTGDDVNDPQNPSDQGPAGLAPAEPGDTQQVGLEFDPIGELPGSGTWILEASAGTGKTYTIAALAARYLAEGVPLESIMMVTFSRAATQELRTRVRAKLVEVEAGLRHALAPRSVTAPVNEDVAADQVVALLCTGDHELLSERLTRISAALSDFDAATIATTHEFCGRMLDGLGVLNDLDPNAVHTDDLSDLVREVATDFWLRKYASSENVAFTVDEAVKIVQEVAWFEGELSPDDEPNAERLAFARAARRELKIRQAARGLRTHHDLLTGLADLLAGRSALDPDNPDPLLAAEVAERLSARFSHVLIDEFQDTDPVQWQIVRSAFVGRSTVVLIGDPKQAIYGFRDADVQSYLAAVREPGSQLRTLGVNWRSDKPLLDALQVVLGEAQLGDERIRVRPVRAAHETSRLRGLPAEQSAPVRLRTLGVPEGKRNGHRAETLRRQVIDDLVSDIAESLSCGAQVDTGAGWRALQADDIAVLVSKNKFAERIRRALQDKGIPAVFAGATSVYLTDEATDWRLLLTALDQPRDATIRRAALTCFVGWSFEDLARADDNALNELSATIRSWSRTLAEFGVAALLEAMNTGTVDRPGLSARLLATAGGERRLTDVRHIAQSLHAARIREQLGTAALLEWLTHRCRNARSDEERTRRLDTDADAVQIMTVHRSKGLQFPIVHLPDQWDLSERDEEDASGPFSFHAPDSGGLLQRHLFIGTRSRQRAQAYDLHQREERDESLRKFYVAATRAQCQVVAYWCANQKLTPTGPLHRLLARAGKSVPEDRYPFDLHPSGLSHLRHPGISIGEIGPRSPEQHAFSCAAGGLKLRRLQRGWDEQWRRTSYSGLTAIAHEFAHSGASAVDDEVMVVSDEVELGAEEGLPSPVDEPAGGDPDLAAELQRVSPMSELPRGTSFGTLVHTVYEHFDPAAGDLAAELLRVVNSTLQRLPAESMTAEELAEALLPAAVTPLGEVADGLRLCDIPASDRLAELDFEYPLAGGEQPVGTLTLARVADLLQEHLGADDPLADYPERLRDPLLSEQVLRGFLIGSIDAVLRIPCADKKSGNRYLVVDYKTNWLGSFEPGAVLRLESYRPQAMAEAMMEAHYPLQALLYAVALHRFLRWRLPDYDPRRHLGGVAYLFVRGMAGEQTPVVDGMPCGVFTWYPPADLVTELSDLIDRSELESSSGRGSGAEGGPR